MLENCQQPNPENIPSKCSLNLLLVISRSYFQPVDLQEGPHFMVQGCSSLAAAAASLWYPQSFMELGTSPRAWGEEPHTQALRSSLAN